MRECFRCGQILGTFETYCFACGTVPDSSYMDQGIPDPEPIVSIPEPGTIYPTKYDSSKWAKCVHGYVLKEAACPYCAIPSRDPKTCPDCGTATVRKQGKYGGFTACSAYPKCRWTVAKGFDRARRVQEEALRRQADAQREEQRKRDEDRQRLIRQLNEEIERGRRRNEEKSYPSTRAIVAKPKPKSEPKAPARSDLEQRFANLDFGDESDEDRQDTTVEDN